MPLPVREREAVTSVAQLPTIEERYPGLHTLTTHDHSYEVSYPKDWHVSLCDERYSCSNTFRNYDDSYLEQFPETTGSMYDFSSLDRPMINISLQYEQMDYPYDAYTTDGNMVTFNNHDERIASWASFDYEGKRTVLARADRSIGGVRTVQVDLEDVGQKSQTSYSYYSTAYFAFPNDNDYLYVVYFYRLPKGYDTTAVTEPINKIIDSVVFREN